ncbi:MFS transporter [Xylocopilactobacillus apis]|uniref:MFS transporter n=1 Tax=Xylocopilactobacillus apis TaxID=2932183 RepID=A0AAU9CW78_9LACO|nr:MFS transporter [Xylocopilactobacillus apis]BDR55599.1 MFS transporter [Xylocopilactobacillus apis]
MNQKLSLSKKLTVTVLFVAVFIVGLDSFIISPLLPTIAKSFNSDVSHVGVGITMYTLFYAFGAALVAPFLEKVSQKVIITIGFSLFTLANFLGGTAFNLTTFFIYQSLAGFGAGLVVPNVYAYVGRNFSQEHVGKIIGIVMSALSLSIAVGALIGSFAAKFQNWNWIFYCYAFFSVITLILIIRFTEKDEAAKIQTSNYLSHYANIFTNPLPMYGLIVVLFSIYGFYTTYTYLGNYIEKSLNIPVGSTVFVVYGLSNFVSSFIGGWIGKKLGSKKTILIAGIVSCLSYFSIGLTGNTLGTFVIGLAVLGFSRGLSALQLTAYNSTIIPESRVTMMSLNNTFIYLGTTLGSTIGGILYDKCSFSSLTVISIGFTIAAFVLAEIAIVQKERKLESQSN